jgi:hypothetical protein
VGLSLWFSPNCPALPKVKRAARSLGRPVWYRTPQGAQVAPRRCPILPVGKSLGEFAGDNSFHHMVVNDAVLVLGP